MVADQGKSTAILKKILTSFLLFCTLPLFAGEDWQKQAIGPFGGLNNRDSSYIISSNQAQDLLNVNITANGKSVKKRPGYATAFSLNYTSSPVHGTYLFYDSSGNDVALYFNDVDIMGSVAGVSPSVIYSTGTNGATYQCSDYLGFAYCANSARDALFKTNGVTVQRMATTVSTGTMVSICPTRLAMAGFAEAPSRIDFSADTDFSTWGTGPLGSSPVQLTVNSPGSRITHITYAFGRLMWFKQTSFGYVLIGNQPFQTDWVIKTISNSIGTIDNSSTQDFNGNLYFRGQDGHIYVYDGSNVTKLSREIQGTISMSQIRSQNNLSLTGSDWNAGTFSGNIPYVDTQTALGNLQTTFPETFSSYRDGNGGTKQVWVPYMDGTTGTTSISNGYLNLVFPVTGGFDKTGLRTSKPLAILQAGTSFQMRINSISQETGGGTHNGFYLMLSTGPVISDWIGQPSHTTWQAEWISTGPNTATFASIYDGTDSLVTVSTTVAMPFDFTFWVSTLSYSYSVNGTLISQGSRTDSSGLMQKPQYAYLAYQAINSPGSCKVDDFRIAPETFTFTSAPQTISSNVTSWDTFNATKNESAGNLSFSIRTANNVIYTPIISGNIPTNSITTYWQVQSTFTLTDPTTISPLSITNISQNWFEGIANNARSIFFDDKVWWCVASGNGQLTNNRILIYDLLYQGWTLYDLPSNSFYIRNNALYFGSSNGGTIYKYGSGDNDAGAAINAYWKSKDFFGDDPFTLDELTNISIAAKSVASSSMTVTYTYAGNNSASYTMGLGGGIGYVNKNTNLPAGRVSSVYNLQFGNDVADQPFEVYGIQVGLRPKSWVPTSN